MDNPNKKEAFLLAPGFYKKQDLLLKNFRNEGFDIPERAGKQE